MDTIATSKTQADRLRLDRRSWPRTTRKIRVLILPDDCALDEPYAGWIVDSSSGGVRLAIENQAIEIGAVVRVRQPGSSNRTPWMIARVKHRRRLGEVYMLGCEFVRVRAAQPARCA